MSLRLLWRNPILRDHQRFDLLRHGFRHAGGVAFHGFLPVSGAAGYYLRAGRVHSETFQPYYCAIGIPTLEKIG